MKITRRSVLQLSGVTLAIGLSGCSLRWPFGVRPPTIESQTIGVENAQCVGDEPRQHEVTVSYHAPNHRLSLEGALKTTSPCPNLFLTSDTGVGKSEIRDDAILLTIDPATSEDCEPCPAEVEYAATVTFDHDPSKVYIYHTEETDDGWKRVGPIETETID